MVPLVSNPVYSYAFDHRHRFPMAKFRLLVDYLRERGIASTANLFRPGKAKRSALELAHCGDYLDRFIHNRQSRQKIIIYRNLLTWQHVSRSLVTQTPPPPNQKFAFKILEALAKADNLAVRYLAHKALKTQ